MKVLDRFFFSLLSFLNLVKNYLETARQSYRFLKNGNNKRFQDLPTYVEKGENRTICMRSVREKRKSHSNAVEIEKRDLPRGGLNFLLFLFSGLVRRQYAITVAAIVTYPARCATAARNLSIAIISPPSSWRSSA